MKATTADNGIVHFNTSRQELEGLLGVDIVPDTLLNTWNSLVVWRQSDTPFLTPWHSIQRTEHMVRSVQQGKEEKVYHGRQANLIPNDAVNHTGYYEISSDSGIGLDKKRSVDLTLGMNEPGIIAVPEAIGHIAPGFNFPMQNGVEGYPALTVFVQYNKPEDEDMSVFISSDDYLRVGRAENIEQMTSALRAIGDVMSDIREGETPNFNALRTKLINEIGLEDLPSRRPHLDCMVVPMAQHAAAIGIAP